MFRFQDKQLHWMLLLILVTSGIFFFFYGMDELPSFEGGRYIHSMDDFSEGWLLQKKNDTEIVFFPVTYDAKAGDTLSFYHRTPDMTNESLYLVFKTNRQPVQVKIDNMVIYEGSKRDGLVSAYHIVKILPEYQNKNILITYSRETNKKIIAPTLLIGTKSQLFGQIFLDNWGTLLWGGILFLVCFCMLLPYGLIKNTQFAKSTLLYGCLEGMVFGILCVLQGNAIPILTGWNCGVCLLRICFLVLLGMLHLIVMRCFAYKKSIQIKIGIGIVGYLIYFISVMVLQFFHLILPDTIVTISKGIFVAVLCFYIGIFGKYLSENDKKETRFIVCANGILLASVIIQIIMMVVGRDIPMNHIVLPVGVTIYQVLLLYYGMKRALHLELKMEQPSCREEDVRARVMEQMNPNLLFASFHTLQNLIKKGSSNSVKMIYYISVYFKDNLKAMENQGETIPFSEELEHILAYLQLQKTRNDNLNYGIECKVKDFQVPRNSIEPLVENAVKHGIAGKGNTGNVVLRTYMRSDGYAIQIIDDGIGFDKKILKNNSNTAVLHLISLLEILCKAQIEIISREGKGTVITIILPMLDNELMGTAEDDELTS